MSIVGTESGPKPEGARPHSAGIDNSGNQQTVASTADPAVRMLKRLHFFAGIICAPLIFVAALTGFLYAFAPTAENLMNRDLTVTEIGESRVPLSELVETAQQEHPDLTVSGIRLDDAPSATTRILFSDPDLESASRAVFLDPYTGTVLGESTQYGSSYAFPLRQWLSEGHRMAWLGEPGRFYSEIAASWLGVLALGGLVLWWTRQRGNRPEKARAMFRIGNAKGRTRNMRWHGAIGAAIALGMVFLTITGLTWSKVAGENIGDARAALNWGTPAVSTALNETDAAGADEHAGHEGHSSHGSSHGDSGGSPEVAVDDTAIDRVAATALAELRAPLTLTPPTSNSEAWKAAEDRETYRYSNDAIAVDGATGEVTDRLNFADWPFMAKMSAWLIQLHMGTLFGIANQVILGLLAAGIIALIIRGYLMWWQRRPRTGDSLTLAAAPPRAERSGAMTAGTWILIGSLVAYSVIAPVFGITCLAFVVISSAWHHVSKRRSRYRAALPQ